MKIFVDTQKTVFWPVLFIKINFIITFTFDMCYIKLAAFSVKDSILCLNLILLKFSLPFSRWFTLKILKRTLGMSINVDVTHVIMGTYISKNVVRIFLCCHSDVFMYVCAYVHTYFLTFCFTTLSEYTLDITHTYFTSITCFCTE